MTHRSNQAVASQGRPLTRAEPPHPRRERPRRRRAAALSLVGAGVAVLAAGVWLVRLPIGEMALRGALAERGLVANFRLIQLDFSGATLADLTIGDAAHPDFSAGLAEAGWTWRGLTPALQTLRVLRPELRLNVDQSGRISAGSLDGLRASGAGGARPSVPRIRLDVENGAALITAPFGLLRAEFEAGGTLGRDFSALARLTETTHAGDDYALDSGLAELTAQSQGETISLHFTGRARSLTWAGARFGAANLDLTAHAPIDLANMAAEASWRIGALRANGASASGVSGAIRGRADLSEAGLTLAGWTGEGHVSAVRAAIGAQSLLAAQIDAHFEGSGARARGAWSATAARYEGMSVRSARPSAAGEINLLSPGAFNGDARVLLAGAALDSRMQANLARAIPNIASSPVGPTLAQAEFALDRAADRFDIAIPLSLASSEGITRLTVTQPIEARAASGAVMRVTPLRGDAPALVMQWPGGALHGAVALDIDGGGLPSANMLVDSIDWAPGAPFEADGTVTIRQWRAAGASIAADEIGIVIAVQPDRLGRIDLTGPLTINGPLGDGAVRDMIADLDLAVQWGAGWRITPNRGCLPVRIAGLDAAGLSFQGGAFGLCAGQSGAIASANASGQWSDGFVIESLRLNGRMAGPGAQPARLSAARVVGRFSGGGDAVALNLEASTPALSVDMSPERTLTVTGETLTANAHFGGAAWRVEGAFQRGSINDPGFPGEVSAIQGRWSAAPEDERVVVRVAAGEAMVTAHAVGPEDERPMFNAMRLADVSAEMRGGAVNAQGALLLDDKARALANFTAHHEIEAGAGQASFTADAMEFGDALQPYEITELVRGVVENVRGPAGGAANVVWDRDGVRASGRVRLNGVSLALATIPIIEDIRGDVEFDNLFTLTTPPGQNVTVGLVNPGIAVRSGQVRFQLLGDLRVAVEQAEFEFASGVLALEPTTITLGADEAEVRLLLRNVDAATLLSQLNMPDLHATGRIEGSFPLLLARNTAYVKNGELRAAPGGGVIQYVGQAGEGATGMSRVAFDALRSFSYDDLRITLNGDISGEVVSAIHFTGENTGRPVDLTEIAAIPGVGRVTARGVPFVFNVTVTAPFRRLAQTAAGFVNPGELIGDAVNGPPQEDQPEPENQ